MYFDRFDICEAHYLFLSNYHEGMTSLKYKRLSRMTRYFKPSPLLCVERLSSNGKEIYEALCLKEANKVNSHQTHKKDRHNCRVAGT